MSTIKQRIEEIKNFGYDIDFSIVFNKSIENYKKIALNGGIVFILFSIVMFSVLIGIMGAIYGFSGFTETLANFKVENFTVFHSLIYVLFVSLISGLLSPLFAGILKMAYNAANHKEVSIGNAFEYYKNSFFKDLFISTVLISMTSLGINTLFESMTIRFIGPLITYIISFFTFLTIPLIIFGELKAIEAIQSSFILVSKQIFVMLGLLIVGGIIVCIGIIGFCIGIFFTLPFLYSLHFCIYDEIIGTYKKEEMDEIGTTTE